jgi:2-keto-4-pentenoate hydratase/2-oxohepta-3-ene-1,7-dioic acid hydratase in catechol pathway
MSDIETGVLIVGCGPTGSTAVLEPGDVIATGTPGGVGAKRNPPLWFKPGDTVEVEIDRLGTLRNGVEDEA